MCTDIALHATVEELHELPEKIVIISIETTSETHVPEDRRVTLDNLGRNDGISYVHLEYGFHDSPNIPHALEHLRQLNKDNHELNLDLDKASYFISMSRVVPSTRHNLSPWRKHLYSIMSRNALSTSDYYRLPIERTIEMESLIPL